MLVNATYRIQRVDDGEEEAPVAAGQLDGGGDRELRVEALGQVKSVGGLDVRAWPQSHGREPLQAVVEEHGVRVVERNLDGLQQVFFRHICWNRVNR